MTKTDAVNICLLGIGVDPVSNLDASNLDAEAAEFFVDTANELIQLRGWWFNKEGSWNLEPDSVTGEIPVPSGVLDIIAWGTSRETELSQKAGKVYDTVDHTFDLRSLVNQDGKIEFYFLSLVDFEDLPGIAQPAVAYMARRMMAQDLQGDQNKYKMDTADEERAYAMLAAAEGRNKKINHFTHNPDASSIPWSIGGPNAMWGLRSSSKVIFPRRRT